MQPPSRLRAVAGVGTLRHTKAHVLVHVVWSTWNRSPVLAPALEALLVRVLNGAAQDVRCPLHAVGVADDHVHVLLTVPATIRLADAVHRLKGASSHAINQAHLAAEHFRWQAHYAAFSVSAHGRSRVIAYLAAQRAHHAAGTLWPCAENDGAS